MDKEIKHYGVKRRSGRYPWGSGDDPQRSKDILSKNDELKRKGYSESKIASHLGISSNELRKQLSIANSERKQLIFDSIQTGIKKGKSNTQIAKEIGISEASVRNYKNKSTTEINKIKQHESISNVLKDKLDKGELIDVGKGISLQIGVSKHTLDSAVKKLESEGYHIHNIGVKQLNTDNWTTIKVLSKEKDQTIVSQNKHKIKPPQMWKVDDDVTVQGLGKIIPISDKRIKIRYKEDGGEDKDGLIEIKKGVKNLDMGEAKYAQVRIQVNDTHYMKGMSVYSNDIPKGYDVVYNTNKSKITPKMDVFKKLDPNPDNPFGAYISKQKGALNIISQEGDWAEWKSKFSTQFLSKQSTKLVAERISATNKRLNDEYKEILAIKNPVIKSKLLKDFSESCEKQSIKLYVDSMNKYKPHVILPLPDIKEHEIYAPNYKQGDKVVLIRYPHGGTFEIPSLVVNNKVKNPINNAYDAIGIHPKQASKLSGADFDGDTAYVIKNNSGKIRSTSTLKELEGFDPKMYKTDNKTITSAYKQTQMGVVSNLITDMTIKGATTSEIARAVKHSMVVIDSEKHNLDWKKSEVDNGIGALKKKYQTYYDPITKKMKTGASTLISRAGSPTYIIDPKTEKKKQVPLISTINDTNILSSGSIVEQLYAKYANNLKALSKISEKESSKPYGYIVDKKIAKAYVNEIYSIDAKLKRAEAYSPKERQAQLLANKSYSEAIKRNPDLYPTKIEKNKLKSQILAGSRAKVGAKRKDIIIEFTDKEWNAINANAISASKLRRMIYFLDNDKLKDRAIPKTKNIMTPSSVATARSLLSRGYTIAEVATRLGVSTSTITRTLKEGE